MQQRNSPNKGSNASIRNVTNTVQRSRRQSSTIRKLFAAFIILSTMCFGVLFINFNRYLHAETPDIHSILLFDFIEGIVVDVEYKHSNNSTSSKVEQHQIKVTTKNQDVKSLMRQIIPNEREVGAIKSIVYNGQLLTDDGLKKLKEGEKLTVILKD